MTTILLSALILGATGSLHCVGMCGPVAMSLPLGEKGGSPRVVNLLLYFAGKTFTYGILGLLFGWIGQQIVLAGFQQALSILLGAAMLLFVVVTFLKPVIFHQNLVTTWIGNKLTPMFSHVIQKQGQTASLWLGMLNGLLPCGLVYAGITAAVATGNAWHAALFMLVFGLGTMPLMFSFLLFTRQLGYEWRVRIRKLSPYFLAALGIILVFRGLDLGIPYLSPHIHSFQTTQAGNVISCH